MSNDATNTSTSTDTKSTQYSRSEMRIIGGTIGELDSAIGEFMAAHGSYNRCYGELAKKGLFDENPSKREFAERRLTTDERVKWGIATDRCKRAANRNFSAAENYAGLPVDFPEHEVGLSARLQTAFETAAGIFDDPKNEYGAF